jgi:uncharacterized protein (DUF1810 family)
VSGLFDLERFVDAQAAAYDRALGELRRGRKTTHWMWFIFPQIRGLGASATSRRFAISSLEEAIAYLAHPLLGSRLRECTQAVLDIEDATLHEIFGGIDSLKFCSCMTLFAQAAPGDPLFRAAIDEYCLGNSDAETLRLLRTPDPRAL